MAKLPEPMANKSPEIKAFLQEIAPHKQGCPICGRPIEEFRDALSEKEFGISGMCQACQDSVFGE